MEKIYRVSKIALVVGFERIDKAENGDEVVKTNQTITYDKLMTQEQLLDLMKEKIEPGEEITCEISPNVIA